MYKHILVPIDGTDFSKIHAAPDEVWHMYAESVAYTGQYLASFRADMKRHAQKLLAEAANTTDVKVETDYVLSASPADAIMKAAKRLQCDLPVIVVR
jgi:nucleotide-binding universal stress UspA family protein